MARLAKGIGLKVIAFNRSAGRRTRPCRWWQSTSCSRGRTSSACISRSTTTRATSSIGRGSEAQAGRHPRQHGAGRRRGRGGADRSAALRVISATTPPTSTAQEPPKPDEPLRRLDQRHADRARRLQHARGGDDHVSPRHRPGCSWMVTTPPSSNPATNSLDQVGHGCPACRLQLRHEPFLRQNGHHIAPHCILKDGTVSRPSLRRLPPWWSREGLMPVQRLRQREQLRRRTWQRKLARSSVRLLGDAPL